jgi:hypothetical protein
MAKAKKPDFSGRWADTTSRTPNAQAEVALLHIAQTSTEIVVIEDSLRLVYKLDGSETTAIEGPEPPPGSFGGRPAYVTSAQWKGRRWS